MTQKKEVIIDDGYIITDDGKVYGKDHASSLFHQQMTEFQKSAQLDPAEEEKWTNLNTVEPPYGFAQLTKMLEVNTEHYRSCRAKSVDTAGLGWSVIEDAAAKKKGSAKDKKRLLDFFRNINPEIGFVEVLDRVLMDFEATGNGIFEVTRNMAGDPQYLYHMPIGNVRRKIGKIGYVQVVGAEERFFQNWGDKYPNGNGDGGKGSPNFVSVKDGKTKQGLTWNGKETANEVLHMLNYHPSSNYYGLPDFLPAIGAIAGNVAARDFNLAFFDNRGMPAYAIIIKGAKLDPELRTLIEGFFNTKLKGSPHRTLVLPVPNKNVEVEFEKLDRESSEGSFSEYGHDNRDEIIRAHGVVPARIGIIATASLGGGSGYSQSETYKNAIIEPRQRRLEFLLNRLLIQEGFKIDGWRLKFDDLDIRNRTQEITNAGKMLDRAVMDVNEVRRDILHLEPAKGGDRPFLRVGKRIVFLDTIDKEEVLPEEPKKPKPPNSEEEESEE